MTTQAATQASKLFMFDPDAETMPREALTALQTARLKQTLERAYANVPHYRKKFDAAGVKPADFKSLSDIVRFPFTLKTDLRDNYPVRHVRGAARTASAPARLVGNDRQADRGRLYQGRPRHLGGSDGALFRLRRRACPATSCTMLTATACSPAALARITGPSGSAARWCPCRAAAPNAR